MSAILTRMGDGYSVELTPDELRRDVVQGSEDAARRAGIPALDDGEIDYLVELFAYPGRITGVERGHEVVLTKDGCANTLYNGQMSSGVGVPLAREQGIRLFERAFCFDTMEVGHPDYSFKPAKPLDNADLGYAWRKRMVRVEVARALRELAGLPTGDLPPVVG